VVKNPTRIRGIVVSQLSILLISAVAAFIPQYSIYIFLAYFAIMTLIMFRRARIGMKAPSTKELGSPIFRESNATRIAMLDAELIAELRGQALASMILLMSSLSLLIIFPIYKATVFNITYEVFKKIIEHEVLALFLAFLLMYEILFGLLSIIRFLVMSRAKFSNILLPQNYALYRSGVLINDRVFLKITANYCYEYNHKRRYVELRSVGKDPTRIRLYTDAASELRDKVRELGLSECA